MEGNAALRAADHARLAAPAALQYRRRRHRRPRARQGRARLGRRLVGPYLQPARQRFRCTLVRRERHRRAALRCKGHAARAPEHLHRHAALGGLRHSSHGPRHYLRAAAARVDADHPRDTRRLRLLSAHLLPRHGADHALQHGQRHPARDGRLQASALLPFRLRRSQHCARPALCDRFPMGHRGSRRRDRSFAGRVRGAGRARPAAAARGAASALRPRGA